MNAPPLQRYLSKEYLAKNPTWDSEDSPWKAALVMALLQRHQIRPLAIADVGCGAGVVLRELDRHLPGTRLTGYDVAPDAQAFWQLPHENANLAFVTGDFLQYAGERPDLVLMLDVIEHLQDPFGFLGRLAGRASWYIFHFPLDLSAFSVVRETPLLHVRQKVGHIHYFTKNLALSLLAESGFEVVEASYTAASFRAPGLGLKSRLAAVPRWLAKRLLGQDLATRLLGGETLLVLARDR
jgi:predicted TPR repeat methyltransferase